jgi:rubrerythrin
MKNTIKEAKKAENYVVELALSFVIKSYSQYIELYKNFQKEKIQNKKSNFVDIHVCDTCGYINIGELPQYCPICSHNKSFFKRINES